MGPAPLAVASLPMRMQAIRRPMWAVHVWEVTGMTMHERITAAVEKRLAVAQAATPGPWYVRDKLVTYGHGDDDASGVIANTLGSFAAPTVDATFIAANDPARIICDCRRDLKVLERHNREPAFLSAWVCRRCRPILRGPCVELRDLAEAYGIGVDDGDG